jgi:DNA-binding response OmpR family regulator
VLEHAGGFRVVAATDYDEGVKAFEGQGGAVDLAVIDVALPGKNGVELAKTLVAAKPEMCVLFVSGHVGGSVIRFYGIDAGDEHFLQKPFDHTTLLRRVQQALVSARPLHQILTAASGAGGEEGA